MRLVDADHLVALVNDATILGDGFKQAFTAIVNGEPTIESERETGKWIHGRELSREMIGDVVTAIFYEGWECSECHCLVQEEREPLWKYCPNCGADMR